MLNMITIVYVLINVNMMINKLYGIINKMEITYVLILINVKIFHLKLYIREYQKNKININVYKYVEVKINNLFGMIKDTIMMLIVHNMINVKEIM